MYLLFEAVMCDCKSYDVNTLQEEMQTLLKGAGFHGVESFHGLHQAMMLEDRWDDTSTDGAGSGRVSRVMTEAEKEAKEKDMVAASEERDSGKKKIEKDLWEN